MLLEESRHCLPRFSFAVSDLANHYNLDQSRPVTESVRGAVSSCLNYPKVTAIMNGKKSSKRYLNVVNASTPKVRTKNIVQNKAKLKMKQQDPNSDIKNANLFTISMIYKTPRQTNIRHKSINKLHKHNKLKGLYLDNCSD